MNCKLTREDYLKIRKMMRWKSNAEIASHLKVNISTVKRIVKKKGWTRTPEEKEQIRSNTRKNFIRAEKRRAIFGLDQKSEVKVFTNRERNALKYCLKRKHYRFVKRGDVVAYYDENTLRSAVYEARGRKLGLKFQSLNVISI